MKLAKKIISVMAAGAAMMSMGMTALAAPVSEATIDTARTASLTVYKYDITAAEKDGVWNQNDYKSTGVYDQTVNDTLGSSSKENKLPNGDTSYGYAVKGVEFGSGFACAGLRGSENNDPYYMENGAVRTRTNNAGGILGGLTTGMPLIFRVAVKPTPSIARPQESVHLSEKSDAVLEIHGRHDPCIVPRAVPCVEAAAAIAILDALLEENL